MNDLRLTAETAPPTAHDEHAGAGSWSIMMSMRDRDAVVYIVMSGNMD
jgi:hypothetical protein